MNVAWATDVHLNFLSPDELDRFCQAIAGTGADAVVLSGDIAEAPTVRRLLTEVSEKLARPIYFVLGNHDFYHGSIAEVRADMAALHASDPWLRWLPAAGVIELTDDTALIGHSGWGDGRYGDYQRSPIVLNDYVLIRELSGVDKATRLDRLHALGDEAAAYIADALRDALGRRRRVLCVTHVPPYRDACWHEGAISDDNWLPHFTCKALGDALTAVMRAHPDRELLVICGHTHSEGEAKILPNLRVLTGAAEYGEPAVQDVLKV